MKCKIQKNKKCYPAIYFAGFISAPVHDAYFGEIRCYYCSKEFKIKYVPKRKRK